MVVSEIMFLWGCIFPIFCMWKPLKLLFHLQFRTVHDEYGDNTLPAYAAFAVGDEV